MSLFEDPLMQFSLGLLGGSSPNFGQNLMQAAMFQQQMAQTNNRGKLTQMELEKHQMEMEKLKKQRAKAEQQKMLAAQYFSQGAPGAMPADGMGPPTQDIPPQFDMPGYLRAAVGKGVMDPLQYHQLTQKEKPKTHVLGEGGSLVDDTGRTIASGAPKLPTGMVLGPGGQRMADPAYVEMQERIRKAGATNLSVNQGLEKKEHQEKGALNVKNFGELQAAAGAARKENSILSALEKNPVDTSRAAPVTATAAAWLSAAGMGGERAKEIAKNAQTFNAGAMEMVLNRQLAQKGPQTESDARRLEQTVASLGNTKAANTAIIAFSKAQNNRVIAQEKFYNDWWRKNQTYEGADIAWLGGEGGASLWDDPALSKLSPANSGIDDLVNKYRTPKP